MDPRGPFNVGPLIQTKLFPVVPHPDTHGPDFAYTLLIHCLSTWYTVAQQRGAPHLFPILKWSPVSYQHYPIYMVSCVLNTLSPVPKTWFPRDPLMVSPSSHERGSPWRIIAVSLHSVLQTVDYQLGAKCQVMRLQQRFF